MNETGLRKHDGVIGDTLQFEGTWPSNPWAEQSYVIFHLPLKQPVVRFYKHGTRDFNMEQLFVFHSAGCMNHLVQQSNLDMFRRRQSAALNLMPGRTCTKSVHLHSIVLFTDEDFACGISQNSHTKLSFSANKSS